MPVFGQNKEAKIAAIREERRIAFAQEADPLFFKWQRGEATQTEYEAAVAAVRARFPYPQGGTLAGIEPVALSNP